MDNSRILRRLAFEEKLKDKSVFRFIEAEELTNETYSQAGNFQDQPYESPTPKSLPTIALSDSLETKATPTVFSIGQDFFSHTTEELCNKTVTIVFELNLFLDGKDFKQTLIHFVTQVLEGYEANAYHNAAHGFSVFHMSAVFLTLNPFISDALGKEKSLAFLMAALAHDIGHRGYTNSLEVKLSSPIAQRFKNLSVLENFHSFSTMEILDRKQSNIFNSCSRREQKKLRWFITKLILATDMAHHKEHVDYLKDITNVQTFLLNESDLCLGERKQKLMSAVIHGFDISAQSGDMEVAIRWERRMATEFRNESELLTDSLNEESAFLKVFESKTKEDLLFFLGQTPCSIEVVKNYKFYKSIPNAAQAKSQVCFIQNLMTPIWKEVSRLWFSMRHFFINIAKNKLFYKYLSENNLRKAKKFFKKNAYQNILKKKVYAKIYAKINRERTLPKVNRFASV